MMICPECKGTGVAETIGGFDRPCDACHGEQSRPTMTAPKPASDALVDELRNEGCKNGSGGAYAWNARYLCGKAADRIEQLEARIEALSRQSGEVSEAMVGQRLLVWLGGSRDSLSPETVAALQEIARAMQEARDD